MLSDGVGFGKRGLRFGDGLIVQMRNQTVRRPPGLIIGFAHNHVQANTEAHLAAMGGRFGADLSDFFFHQLRRFAPGQIEVDLLRCQILGYIRRPAKIERRARLLHRREVELRVANVNMLAFKGDGFPFQQASPDAGEFGGGLIAFGMVEEHAVARQLLWIAARHQVKQGAAVGQSVQRGRLTCRHGRGDDARA